MPALIQTLNYIGFENSDYRKHVGRQPFNFVLFLLPDTVKFLLNHVMKHFLFLKIGDFFGESPRTVSGLKQIMLKEISVTALRVVLLAG